ncbi:MAG TPA: ABC transporter ATP-binding protein [Clostridia bacterium]|nr:ABC transporter ATP-binding protein [Clostridia bacterium]
MEDYIIEMLHITKEFPGIKANDDVTLKVRRGEIHALLGENGAGKSTLMSVLFGLLQQEQGTIKINGKPVKINSPNDANDLNIGMVHQHFKLVHNFSVLENIVLGVETTKGGFLEMDDARTKVVALSDSYRLRIEPDAVVSSITVGMQQRVEILKMLYRENEILIFDEPTAVLTPQEIDDLMRIMRDLVQEGKSIIFITHKLDEIKAVADRCTVLRKGKYIGTVEVADTSKEELSEMMVGRPVNFIVDKGAENIGETILTVKNVNVKAKRGSKQSVNNVSFNVRAGEIVCIAGIDGNGQSELVYALTGMEKPESGTIRLHDTDISKFSIRKRTLSGISHIPEDRQKYGLVLEFNLSQNLVLQSYFSKRFQKAGFIKFKSIEKYSNSLIEQYDIRSGQGVYTLAGNMSGGNQQKAILAREIDRNPELLIAVQPTRGLDVGAIEYIHKQLVAQRDSGKAVLLISLELDEVMNISDRILVIYEGEIVADLDPKQTNVRELGLYMAGSKKGDVNEKAE